MANSTSMSGRYQRIFEQLNDLMLKTNDPVSRMATIVAVLHHKMDYYFWTGFYLLKNDELLVGPYQGPLACMKLERDKGVCWAGIRQQQTIIVPDVHQFPGHIACDSRSNSEIVVPLFDQKGLIAGVLDVDSSAFNSFSKTDQEHLEKILSLVYRDSSL